MTKLRSGLVLPSHTSSVQPAVHSSQARTLAFCLKWLADLEGQEGGGGGRGCVMTVTGWGGWRIRRGSLGLGGDQDVGEQEEVAVLRLHPRLELRVSMEEEAAVRVEQEGLDQRAALGVDGRREALSAHGTRSVGSVSS